MLVEGRVLWDDLARAMFSTAACIFEVEPLAVVAPRDAEDVKAVLAYAFDRKIPVLPRGGGSSLAGQAVGRAIILDCALSMNAVLRVDKNALTATVQPGVVLGRLNRHLARDGLFFAPDPSSADYCTIGGMVANNSGGARSVKYGSTTSHVLSLKAVLPGGLLLDTADFAGAGSGGEGARGRSASGVGDAACSPGAGRGDAGGASEIYNKLCGLLRANEALIAAVGPKTTKNSCGYNLRGALGVGGRCEGVSREIGPGGVRVGEGREGEWGTVEDGGPGPTHEAGVAGAPGAEGGGLAAAGINLCKLLVGSEGTLGTIVEATLKLTPLPATRGAALVGLSSLEAAGEAIVELLELGPSALELMGQTFLELLDRKDLERPGAFMAEADTALLVEFEGREPEEVEGKLDEAERMMRRSSSFVGIKAVRDPAEAQQVWGLRSAAVAILNRMEGPEKPIAFIEDVTVRPEKLPEFIRGELEIFEKHGVKAGVFGHGGDGDLHVRPVLNPKNPDHIKKMRLIAEDVYDLAAGMEGSPTGEHGDGRLRTSFIERFYGEVTPLFGEVKAIFDPEGIMNPGDKVAGDDDYVLDKNLRYGASYKTIPTNEIFDELDLVAEIEKCHGCGACRAYCPVGSTTNEESGSARTKANLLRRLITGHMGDPRKALLRDDLKAVFDLCFNCRLCLTECPTRVDVPRLAAEARACYVKAKGLDRASLFVANSYELSRMASLAPRLSNLGVKGGVGRALLGRFVGVDSRRRLPEFSAPPMRLPTERAVGTRKVLYFPGCFALFNDAEDEGRAALEVLRKVGVSVWVPKMECCGIARVTLGDKEGAARRARSNVSVLHEAVREGYSVVAGAASCCLAIKEDYPALLGSAEAREVAANTFDLFEYLAALFKRGEGAAAPGPVRMRAVHHVPCHLLAQGVADRTDQVLRMIPGLEIMDIADGCCGMAGTFGMKSRNFDLSMKIGSALFDEVRRVSPDVVVTGCGTCKIQLEQGTGFETRHPIWLLRKAFASGGPEAFQGGDSARSVSGRNQ